LPANGLSGASSRREGNRGEREKREREELFHDVDSNIYVVVGGQWSVAGKTDH